GSPPDEPWPLGYDVMVGLTGLGVYALERLPRGSSAEILREVIGRLEMMSERNEEGLTWLSPAQQVSPQFREKYPDGYYNLGVAHGVSGIIGFLGMSHSAGIERPK